jgi:hypothetical protein
VQAEFKESKTAYRIKKRTKSPKAQQNGCRANNNNNNMCMLSRDISSTQDAMITSPAFNRSILVCDNSTHKGCKQDLFLLVLFRNFDLYSAYADDVSEVHSASIFSVKVISES